MKPLVVASVAALVLATVPGVARAQTGPDFSGKWRISQAKSSRGATGNSASVNFPSELIIKQSPAELHVEMRLPRTDPVTAVYKLDGTEVTVATPAGIFEKAKARWDGGKLVITARRVVSTPFGDFVTDSTEVWSRSATSLTIGKTQTAEGVSATETAVFDKDGS